jgi:hypothetical protein
MRVKIEDTWYQVGVNCKKLMIQLDKQDKKNIAKMPPCYTKYAEYDNVPAEEVRDWMEVGKDEFVPKFGMVAIGQGEE